MTDQSVLRIAFISHEYPPDTGRGGIGTYTFQMARLMYDMGNDVEVFTASYDRTISEVYNGVLTHRIQISDLCEFNNLIVNKFSERHNLKGFDLFECPEIGAEGMGIKEDYPDLPMIVRLHTPAVLITRLHNSYTPFWKKLRFVFGGLRKGVFDLGSWSSRDKNQFSDADYLITEKATLITAPSEAMKSWAVKFWGINKSRIRVVPNPYIPDKSLIKLPVNSDSKRITFLGRLNVLKGLVAFGYALPRVLNKYPDWSVRFVGANEKSHLKNISMRSWLEDKLQPFASRIEWHDWIEKEELSKIFSDTDIVVIPSLFESFSYVCAEAMSAGKGIVGSEIGGINELLKDTGMLIHPKSPNQIANAILLLIDKSDLRVALGENARARILHNYSGSVIGEQTLNIYNDVKVLSKMNNKEHE